MAVGPGQPGGTGQRWLPADRRVRVQVVLEKLFLQTRNQTRRIRSSRSKPPGHDAQRRRVAVLPHLDPGDSEGHRFDGGPGEHHRHRDLHVSHVALGLGQKTQTLNEGRVEEKTET